MELVPRPNGYLIVNPNILKPPTGGTKFGDGGATNPAMLRMHRFNPQTLFSRRGHPELDLRAVLIGEDLAILRHCNTHGKIHPPTRAATVVGSRTSLGSRCLAAVADIQPPTTRITSMITRPLAKKSRSAAGR